jgi:ribonuclease E
VPGDPAAPRRRRRRGGRGRGGRGRGRGRKAAPGEILTTPVGADALPINDAIEPDDAIAAEAQTEDTEEGDAVESAAPPAETAVPVLDVPRTQSVDPNIPAGAALPVHPAPRQPSRTPPVHSAFTRGPALPAVPGRFSVPTAKVLPGGRMSFGKGKLRHQFRPSNRPNWPAPPADTQARQVPPVAPEQLPHGAETPMPAAPVQPTETRELRKIVEPQSEYTVAVPAEVRSAVPYTPSAEDASTLAPFAEDIEIEEINTPLKRHEPTGREMLINVVEGEEVRIAIVQKNQLEELYMERSSTESHIGNIYKGRVMNVEPSIQAAFIDFGIGKNGFLHISDLHPQYFPRNYQPQVKPHPQRAPHARQQAAGAEDAAKAEAPAAGAEEPKTEMGEPVSQASAGSEPFGALYSNGDEGAETLDDFDVDDDHMQPMEKVGRKTPRRDRPPIQHALRRGQEVLVQVTKEGIGTKGPTLTTYISIPGRYLVMMPGMKQLGVSRKIDNDDQRRELRRILEDLNPPKNLGFIIRTAGLEQSKKELQSDLNYLLRMWKVVASRIRTQKSPSELYQESDLVIRTIRDVFSNQIDRIVVDNEPVASRVRDFLSIVNPRSASVVELYTGQMPLFQKHGVEREIEKIHSRRVEMANGGSLVIDSTEALVAIDVNSGRYRETRDAEMTAFNMNKEAVKEVCRQLRLRDLGGVIVTDFIDMREERHKREIERLLKEYLKDDRAKTKVLRMSQFCMVEMTRQRVRPSLKRSIYQDCPHCHGSALIKTPESVTLDVMRRLAAGTTRNEITRMEVHVYPTVANYLQNRKRKALLELEERSNKRINITPDRNLAGDAIQIEAYDVRGSLVNVLL